MAKLRGEVNAAGEADGVKVSVNDFILKAVATALATGAEGERLVCQGDSVVEFSSVGLAVAVAVEDGLVTPVVRRRRMPNRSLEISLEVKDLAGRARAQEAEAG